jgi:hypothetical protein
MVKLYPADAALAAAKRAHAAYDQGDTFNFDLWRRITNAIGELQRCKPLDGESVN